MVIMTAKVPKRRILLVVLLLLAAAVVLALCLGGAKHGGEKPQRTDAKGGTNEARIAYLSSYGWEVSEEPVQTQEVRVPAEGNEVFERYVYYLCAGLVSIINLYDPEVIVLGGGVSKAGDFLLEPLRKKGAEYVFYKDLPYAEIKIATLGNDAGIIGAAAL